MANRQKSYISIGDMAKLNHTTVATLRLYDTMNLLKPCFVDEKTHYRYYDIKQNAKLDMIQYLKELGMELKEIKTILSGENLDQTEAIFKKKKQQTLESIHELQLKDEAIQRTIESIERYKKSPGNGTLTLEYIPARRIYDMEVEANFYEHGIEAYELILKQLKKELLQYHVPKVYYCNAGTIMKKEDFEQLHFVSHRIFVFVDEHFSLDQHVQILENGMYACIYTDGFENETECAKKLLASCRENHYEICGDYICEVLTELNMLSCQQRSMYLRLQIPVKFQK